MPIIKAWQVTVRCVPCFVKQAAAALHMAIAPQHTWVLLRVKEVESLHCQAGRKAKLQRRVVDNDVSALQQQQVVSLLLRSCLPFCQLSNKSVASETLCSLQ